MGGAGGVAYYGVWGLVVGSRYYSWLPGIWHAGKDVISEVGWLFTAAVAKGLFLHWDRSDGASGSLLGMT